MSQAIPGKEWNGESAFFFRSECRMPKSERIPKSESGISEPAGGKSSEFGPNFPLLPEPQTITGSLAKAHPASPENVQYRSVFIQFTRALVRRPYRQALASN